MKCASCFAKPQMSSQVLSREPSLTNSTRLLSLIMAIAYLRGETDDPTSMDNWLSGAVPAEDPVVLPKAVRRATAAVVAQSGDSGKNDGGAVFSALLKSDSFKALVRETVLDVLKSPEGQALLAKAAQK